MIYLVAARDVDLCKIGFALNPERRVASLLTACPFDLDLVAVRPGTIYFERKLHQAASSHHVRREWFRFCPEIVELSNTLADPYASKCGDRSHSDILRTAGHDVIASLTGRPLTTVRSWDQRDSIPADMWLTVSTEGHATLEELAASASRNRPSQDAAA